jgi:hypothetical protein
VNAAAVQEGWDVGFVTDRFLHRNECAGEWITAGYPFRITSHPLGKAVVLRVERALAQPSATPQPGPTLLARRLRAWHQRPGFWEARVQIVPLTGDVNYRYVFYNVLRLSPGHPVDTVWVGVTAADAQSYVPDELPAIVRNGGRAGNESSIASCSVQARYLGRPQFAPPVPRPDVPELVTEEPDAREVLVTLELPLFLPRLLPAGSPVALDRCDDGGILGIAKVNAEGEVTLRLRDGMRAVVPFDNPDDLLAVVQVLESEHPERLASRYLFHLAAAHPRREELFTRVSGGIDTFGLVADRLPPQAGRYLYRVRPADALGRVAADGALLPVVIRVPSTAPPPVPERLDLTADAAGAHLTVRAPGDPAVTHLLLCRLVTPPGAAVPPAAGAEVLRIPNRRDLYPAEGLRLRAPDGTLLAPVAKSLGDADVVVDAAGRRTAILTVAAAARSWVQLWCFALTRDGIPSSMAGPFGTGIPAP